MDGGSWWATVHGVAKSRRRLSDFFFFFLSDFILTVYKGLKSSVSGTGIQTAINIFLLFHSGILSASVSSKHLGPHFRVGAGKRMVEHRYLVNALC